MDFPRDVREREPETRPGYIGGPLTEAERAWCEELRTLVSYMAAHSYIHRDGKWVPVKIPCWGNRPKTGRCQNEATRFFMSLVQASPGIIPRNRAVCADCAVSFRFDHFVKCGSIREVPRDEWIPSP